MVQVRTIKLHYNGEFLRLPGDIYELDEEALASPEAIGIIERVEPIGIINEPIPTFDTTINLA